MRSVGRRHRCKRSATIVTPLATFDRSVGVRLFAFGVDIIQTRMVSLRMTRLLFSRLLSAGADADLITPFRVKLNSDRLNERFQSGRVPPRHAR